MPRRSRSSRPSARPRTPSAEAMTKLTFKPVTKATQGRFRGAVREQGRAEATAGAWPGAPTRTRPKLPGPQAQADDDEADRRARRPSASSATTRASPSPGSRSRPRTRFATASAAPSPRTAKRSGRWSACSSATRASRRGHRPPAHRRRGEAGQESAARRSSRPIPSIPTPRATASWASSRPTEGGVQACGRCRNTPPRDAFDRCRPPPALTTCLRTGTGLAASAV